MSRKSAGRKRKNEQLLHTGVLAIVVGIGLLAAPAFMGKGPATGAVGHAMRMPALVALVLGIAFVALHFIRRRIVPDDTAQRIEPSWTAWAPPELLLAQAHAMATDDPLAAVAIPQAPAAIARPQPEPSWSAKVFDHIEWRRFEAVCEQLFAQAGFETRSQSHGADGGVDIWLHSRHTQGPAAVVQCKHWIDLIGVKEMREFLGVMAAHKLRRGTFATSSAFTADALQFAKDNGINAMDRERLLALIGRRTPQQQAQLLTVAYEGEYWRPTCASCGVKMVERKRAMDDSRFWGCASFPKCRTTLPMRGAIA